jgi:hypothetical protein
MLIKMVGDWWQLTPFSVQVDPFWRAGRISDKLFLKHPAGNCSDED